MKRRSLRHRETRGMDEKVGTKIKETAEALEVEFNDDGTGGGEHAKHSIKGQSMMQRENSLNSKFAALRTNSPLSPRLILSPRSSKTKTKTTRTFR